MAKRRGAKRNVTVRNANPIPAFMPINSFRKRFRFAVQTNAWASGTLNEAQIIIMPGSMCTVTNSTVVSMQVSVKIHKITVWGAAPAAASTSTVAVRYFGTTASAVNTFAAMLQKSDTSTNPAYIPVVSFAPPAGSKAAFWLSADNDGTDKVLALEAPVGSVIEFDLEFNHGMPPAVGSFTSSVAAGTLGVMYWLTQSASAGTGLMVPIGLATTL
jgi:hypothetical protein